MGLIIGVIVLGLAIAGFFIVRQTIKENKEAKEIEEAAKIRSEARAARRQSHNR